MAQGLGAARLNRAPKVPSGCISYVEESCCDMLLCDGVAPRRCGFVPVAAVPAGGSAWELPRALPI